MTLLTEYSRQGPGGQLDPPFLSLPYCVLCNLGARCMGPSCQGLKKSKPRKMPARMFQSPLKTPGLEFLPRLANGPSKTPKIKLRLRKMKSFSPKSDIFNWNGKSTSCSKSDPFVSQPVKPVKPVKIPPVELKIQKQNLRWLQMMLINSGTKKRRKTRGIISSVSPARSSLERRLSVSEKHCKRKSHFKDSSSVFRPHPHFDSYKRFGIIYFRFITYYNIFSGLLSLLTLVTGKLDGKGNPGMGLRVGGKTQRRKMPQIKRRTILLQTWKEMHHFPIRRIQTNFLPRGGSYWVIINKGPLRSHLIKPQPKEKHPD